MQGLYNHHDHGVASSDHHHHHRHHHGDRYQQPMYLNCQRCQILSPWLRQVVLGISGSDLEKLVSRISWININMALSVPFGSLRLFTKQCCAVFFMATLLMASCCDARKIETRSFDRSARNYNRVLRDVHHSSFNSTMPTPSHSTNITASTDASSSPTHSPHVNLQPSSATVERDAAGNSIPREQATKSELVALLISTLEKLNALSVTDSTCLRLKQIVKKDIDSSSSLPPSPLNHKMFEVYLYFEEVDTTTVNNTAPANDDMSNNTNNSLSPVNITCLSDPVIVVPPTYEQAGHPGMGELNGTYMLADGSSSTPESDGNGGLHSGRLSRTQIVVISTCSSIIGMFFIVAAILRIRNYIKRARLEQELAKRPKFRSCSVALRGATQSMEQLRRDSLVSKTSHQNSDTTKGSSSSQTNGYSRENSSASSPRHDPDTAPLLLLTGAAQVSNPASPSELQASLQYIDEDVDTSRKKMISPASITSNAVHLDANLKQCGHCNSEKILAEAINFCKRGPRTEFSGSNASMPCRQNGQAGCRSEGNVNPSFGSGSIGYILLREPDFPDCGSRKKMSYNLNPINKTRGTAEVMPRVFAQTSNTEIDQRTVNLKVNNCSAKDLQNNFDANKSSPEFVSLKHESQSRGSLVHNDQQNPHKNYSGMGRTTAVPGDALASSISQNNASSVEKQIKAHLSREHFSDQSLRADIGDKLYPLLDISSFGFSQPDVSLSSITNQGNGFFGQKEYYYPTHQPNGLQTYKRGAFTDNDKGMQIACSSIKSEGTDLNVNKPTVEAPQCDHANSLSKTNSSDIHIVNKVDNITSANQVPRNTLVDPVARNEQSVCDGRIQDVTTRKNVLETSRPNTNTTCQQKSKISAEILDQNSNVLAVQAVTSQSTKAADEELQSRSPACEAMQSATLASRAPSEILHLITAEDAGGMLQSGRASDTASSGMLQSSPASDIASSGMLQSSPASDTASSGMLQSSIADGVVSNEKLQSSIADDSASSGILQSGKADDALSNEIMQSSTEDVVVSNEMLQSSTTYDIALIEMLQSSTADDIASNEMLQSFTSENVVSNEILESSTTDDSASNEILPLTKADNFMLKEMFPSGTADDVLSNVLLQSSTADDIVSNEKQQTSTADDIVSNEMLQSSIADDIASNEMLQRSTADDIASNEMLQSTTADDIASNKMLQSSTADGVVSNEKQQSSTADDSACGGILQPGKADDVVSNEIMQSSTEDDAVPNEMLQSSTTDDIAFNEMLHSSTADDAVSNEMLQSASAENVSNEILQSSTENNVMLKEMLQSRSVDDEVHNEILQSSTVDDVTSTKIIQSSTADDVVPNAMLQSISADELATNGMLSLNTSDDIVPSTMLQSSTADDVACNEILQSSTADDGECNEMLQPSTESDVVCNGILQSGLVDDVTCNEILRSSREDDATCNGMLQSSTIDYSAPSGVLQLNKPADVTQGLPVKVLTSIYTRTDEDILRPLQEMADENVMDEDVFIAKNSPECEAETAFSRSFSDSLDTFTASDSEQSSCQELQSSAELSDQFTFMSQCNQACNGSPNIDQPLSDASCRQSMTHRGLETEPCQIIDDYQRNNNSLTDVNNRPQINGVVSTDPHGSSVNSTDLCHQLLSLTTQNQVLNSSTY